MCPLCVCTLVLAATGTASVGGVTALAVNRIRAKRNRKPEEKPEEKKENKP